MLRKGLIHVEKFKVKEEHLAKHVGSGELAVLSTPSLIAFMEKTCRTLAGKYLPEKQTTVGVHVDIKHFKPTPLGGEVEVKAELISVDGKRLTFWVEAWYNQAKIAHGIHERHIIDKEKFVEKIQ
ncbi:MAG: thioesterase [Thermoprotei archaeon]|nr:MAG: thioesterase [Thermoprotei archaeon]